MEGEIVTSVVLFPPPFYFVFDISNLLSYIQNNFSYELARPIMGTIFLVTMYIFVWMLLVAIYHVARISFNIGAHTQLFHIYSKCPIVGK